MNTRRPNQYDYAPAQWDKNTNIGPGLYVDPRAQHGADEVLNCCIAYVNSLPAKFRFDIALTQQVLRNQLLEIANWYWSDYDHDHRPKRADVKAEIQEIRPALAALLCNLRRLSPHGRQIIDIEISKDLNVSRYPTAEHALQFTKQARTLARATNAIVKPKNTRVAKIGVKRSCRKLISLWIKISNKEFNHGLDSKYERSKNRDDPMDEFYNIEPQFVLVVLKAIDPTITFGAVRTGLRPNRRSRAEDAKG